MFKVILSGWEDIAVECFHCISRFDPGIVSAVTVMTICGDWTWVCGDRATMALEM